MVLQNLYRLISIHSNGYIMKEVVLFKLSVGLVFVCLVLYGAIGNLALFLFASCVFIIDYVVYRAYMVERFYKIEKSALRFDMRKLLDAEGANRPIAQEELYHPSYTEETEYVMNNIGGEILEGVNLALDIGCGSGMLTLGLLRKGIRTISLDATLRSLKLTSEVTRRNRQSAEKILADAQHLPFKDSSFDLIVALSVIEHLLDDMIGFKEAVRVTKPKGKVVFSFPSCHSPVYSLYGFLFNPVILLERLVSWKVPQILPRRTKFVYLGELLLTRDRAFFRDVSIHRSYDHTFVKNTLTDLGLVVKLVGYLSARGRKLSIELLQNLATHHPYLAHTFIVIGIRQCKFSSDEGSNKLREA